MGITASKPERPRDLPLHFYLAWVDAWISDCLADPSTVQDDDALSLDQQVQLFQQQISATFPDLSTLRLLAHSFRRSVRDGKIPLGGKDAPSCDETNLASEKYNPVSPCSCKGLYPIPANADIQTVLEKTNCTAIRNTLKALDSVLTRQTEWNPSSLYTPTRVTQAVEELILANSDIQPRPHTCQGPPEEAKGYTEIIPSVHAPDRRPSPQNDASPAIHHQLFPMAESVKFCLDAKYYFVLGAVHSNPTHDGLIRAIADAGNDILIGDYCEVADPPTLKLLQRTGAAAVAFLKLCVLSDLFAEWAFDNLMALMLHFRVLGYYRDHAREDETMPTRGLYGSRMTGILAHRYIDLGLVFAVGSAHVVTGETISEAQNVVLSEACTLINDLVDLRSDTARRQRENVVLRGIRGNICEYLDGLVGRCLERSAEAVRLNKTCALVLMAFCNWAVMASHHKVFEVFSQVSEVTRYPVCEYDSVAGRWGYESLLDALIPYGTLGEDGPSVSRTRAEMDMRYGVCRLTEDQHLAWVADITRSLLNPITLRRIVDVVHFEWTGGIGDVNYCP